MLPLLLAAEIVFLMYFSSSSFLIYPPAPLLHPFYSPLVESNLGKFSKKLLKLLHYSIRNRECYYNCFVYGAPAVPLRVYLQHGNIRSPWSNFEADFGLCRSVKYITVVSTLTQFAPVDVALKVVRVKPQAIHGKKDSRFAQALDSQQNTIQVRDTVKVVDGPFAVRSVIVQRSVGHDFYSEGICQRQVCALCHSSINFLLFEDL